MNEIATTNLQRRSRKREKRKGKKEKEKEGIQMGKRSSSTYPTSEKGTSKGEGKERRIK